MYLQKNCSIQNLTLQVNTRTHPHSPPNPLSLTKMRMCCEVFHVDIYLYFLVLQIVRTLSLFLTPAERKCSRLCKADSSFKYDTGLFVQGLLKVPCHSKLQFSNAGPGEPVDVQAIFVYIFFCTKNDLRSNVFNEGYLNLFSHILIIPL